jgi:hypothetical protein
LLIGLSIQGNPDGSVGSSLSREANEGCGIMTSTTQLEAADIDRTLGSGR